MKKGSHLCFAALAYFKLAFGFSPSRLRALTECGRFSASTKRSLEPTTLYAADAVYDDGSEVFQDASTNQALSSLLTALGDDVPLPPLQSLATNNETDTDEAWIEMMESDDSGVGWSTSRSDAASGEVDNSVKRGVTKRDRMEKRDKQIRVKQAQLMKDVASAINREDSWAVKKADDMIEEMFRIYDNSRQRPDFRPPTRAYNLLIQALALQRNTGRSAARVLEEMRDNGIRPDLVSYTAVVNAFARSDNGAVQAERLLFYVLEREEFINQGAGTWIALVDSVLDAWAQEGTHKAAERAYSILNRMLLLQQQNVKPGLMSYKTVMKAFSRCGAVEKVMSIVDDIVEGRVELEPDRIMFNVALGAWANSKNADSGVEAMKLMKLMEDLHEEKGYDTKPDSVSFNIVITAWSRSGREDAPMQAERVLQMMQQREDMKPDTVSFNAVLNAWSQSSKEKAAPRAQQILQFLIDHPDLEPDIVTFSTVMNAWARSKDANKVQKTKELLDRLLSMYEDGGRPKNLKPNAIPFNTLINACGFPNTDATDEDRKELMQVAASTFGRLQNYKGVQPDTVTYGNMIKCIGKLLPMGNPRIKLAHQIFDKCIDEGLVGELVWDEMTQTVPFEALEPILPQQLLESLEVGEDIEQIRLPRRWRQNVPLKQDRINREQKIELQRKELGVKEKPRNIRGRIRGQGDIQFPHGQSSWGSTGGAP